MTQTDSSLAFRESFLLDDGMNIGPYIEKALMKHGISQKELAPLIKKSEATISRWVSGRNKPTYKDLIKLSEITGASMCFLISGEECPDSTSRLNEAQQEAIKIVGSLKLTVDQVRGIFYKKPPMGFDA